MTIEAKYSNDGGKFRSTECPTCGEDYKSIAHHWRGGTCDFPELSNRQREIIMGMLMGDASIDRSPTTPRFQVHMTTSACLEWLDRELGPLTSGVKIHYTAEENTERCQPFTEGAECKASYYLRTCSHPAFEEFAGWYGAGGKQFPEDLTLTPLMAKCWYVCDGTLNTNASVPRPRIASINECEREEYLLGLFEEQGFSPSFNYPQIEFPTKGAAEFLDWMGDPIPGFEYKFGIEQTHETI